MNGVSDWIPTREAVEISGYHPEYLRFLIRTGALNARKFGSVWQIERKSLLDYIKEAKQNPDRRHGPKPKP